MCFVNSIIEFIKIIILLLKNYFGFYLKFCVIYHLYTYVSLINSNRFEIRQIKCIIVIDR